MELEPITLERTNVSTPDEIPSAQKTCPFCAEKIQAQAIKCRYCGEFLDGSGRGLSRRPSTDKWYFATSTVVIALLCTGPLALPLVWFHPRYRLVTKLIVTVIVVVTTYACMQVMNFAYKQFSEQIGALGL